MITIDVLLHQLEGVERPDLDHWIAEDWLKPEGQSGHYWFGDIDVARARLIHQLLGELAVGEPSLPIILSLMDQVYESRRRLQALSHALQQLAPESLMTALWSHLEEGPGPSQRPGSSG